MCDHVEAVDAREARGGLAHAGEPTPGLEALLVSGGGLNLGQGLQGADLDKHVVELRVGVVDVLPLLAVRFRLRDRVLDLGRPKYGLAETRAFRVAEGLDLFGPRAVQLLVAAALLEVALVQEVPLVEAVAVSSSASLAAYVALHICHIGLDLIHPGGMPVPGRVRSGRETSDCVGTCVSSGAK